MKVIGLMSGTSCDAIDAALVDIIGEGENISLKLIKFIEFTWPPDVVRQLFQLFTPNAKAEDISRMNYIVGEIFAEAALEVIKAAQLPKEEVDLIGSYGQVIWHTQNPPTFLVIGEPCVISQRTGITVVSDFQARDVAAHGQGAPLVSYFDFIVFSHPNKNRIIQNIGGIANATVLPAGCTPRDVMAFDTGPGNMLINYVVSKITKGQLVFDVDGKFAAQGSVDHVIISEIMKHPFLQRRPPKASGREDFGSEFAEYILHLAQKRGLSDFDIVATVTYFTVQCINDAYRNFIPCPIDEVVLCGGGAYNPVLVKMLKEALSPIPVCKMEDLGLGFSAKAKEAIAFAFLAHETILGRYNNLPSCTGAQERVVLGKITPGRNYLKLCKQIVAENDNN
jgi:anhydro-N-acetylmuramic acid kinase